MKDLIYSLRAKAEEFARDPFAARLMREAADNIERLVAELEHSEWLRGRNSQVYARMGDEVV